MRCYCCDKLLTDAEIQHIPRTFQLEMCSICLEIAMDAAYADGYVRPDEADGVAILDPDDSFEEQSVLFPHHPGFSAEGDVDT